MEPDSNDERQPPPFPAAPTDSPAEYVEVERMDNDGVRRDRVYSTPGGGEVRSFSYISGGGLLKPPTISTWICLIIAWFFLGSRIPFTVFLGLPFNLAAIILAIMCLVRGGMFTGLLVMLLGTVGSLVVYLVGLFRFLAIQ